MLNYKELRRTITILTDDKVTELFCMADDFGKFFDATTEKYALKSNQILILLIRQVLHQLFEGLLLPFSIIRIS